MKGSEPAQAVIAAVAALGRSRHGRGRHGRDGRAIRGDRDARDRPFVRDQDRRSAAGVRADCADRRPGIYDTFFTYNGGDLAHPPLLVQSWTVSKDAKTFVFNLRTDVRFADGTPLTAADAVFSFRRLINLKGNPSSSTGSRCPREGGTRSF